MSTIHQLLFVVLVIVQAAMAGKNWDNSWSSITTEDGRILAGVSLLTLSILIITAFGATVWFCGCRKRCQPAGPSEEYKKKHYVDYQHSVRARVGERKEDGEDIKLTIDTDKADESKDAEA